MAEKDPADKVNLAGTMPPAPHDGLTPIVEALIDDPGKKRYAVCEFYIMSDKVSTDDETHQVVVRWTRIEPVAGDDAKTVLAMLDEARGARTGIHPLPVGDGEGEGAWRQ